MMADVVLSVQGLGKTFTARGTPGVEALRDIHFDLKWGEVIAILGPSGCGKSTIFNILARSLAPSQGSVTYGTGIADFRVGCVFQESRLLPWRTIRDNVWFALQGKHGRGLPVAQQLERVDQLLQLVGVAGFSHRFPHEISGGMQQRVAVARALAVDPQVLLMDEPFGALDALTRRHMQEELARVVEMAGKSVILITHDIDEAFLLADRVLVMTHRPGRIRADIPVPFARPRQPEGLEHDPLYHEIKLKVLNLLREEVEQHLRSRQEWVGSETVPREGDEAPRTQTQISSSSP